MNAKKLYYMLLTVIGLGVIVLLVATLGANKILQKSAKSLLDAKTNTAVLDEKQQQVVKQRTDINKYKGLAEIAKNIVPQDKDQAQTVREIVKIADANGIKLGNITFPSSTLGAAGKPTNAALSQLIPVKGMAGLYSLEIVVQSDTTRPVPYAQFLAFLDGLEHNRRTALVNGLSLQPDTRDPGKLTFTLNVSEYIKP